MNKLYLKNVSIPSFCSSSELCGDGCGEEPLLPVCGSVRPEQPACPTVPSHPLAQVGESCARHFCSEQ